MLEQMIAFLVSWFANPSAWGIGLAVVFGAIWLVCYWPPIFKEYWLWAVLAGSAFLTFLAVVFIQIPLQTWTGQLMGRLWSQQILYDWLLLAGMPQMLYSGLVQEGAKLVPIVIFWWRKGRSIDPKLGLVIGAVAGAGFGIFEAQWIHNSIFASGWTWQVVQTGGLIALAGFWERFFAVAFHIAVSALAGYGLAKGWGWQVYLLVSVLHAFLNYSVLFVQSGIMTTVRVEIFIAAYALLVTYGALWLRWRRPAIFVVVEVEAEPHPELEAESGSDA